MAIKPIEGFYVHDEATGQDGVSKISQDAVINMPEVVAALDDKLETSWERGNINFNGEDASSMVRARTVGYLPLNYKISVNEGYYSYRFYDGNDHTTSSTDWLSSDTWAYKTADANAIKFRLVYKNATDSITNAALANSNVSVLGVVSPFSEIRPNVIPTLNWELGHIDPSGRETSVNNRIRTKERLLFNVQSTITISSGVKYVILTWDEYGNFQKGSGWLTAGGDVQMVYKNAITPTGNEYYFRLAMAYSDDSNIADVDALASDLSISQTYTVTDINNASLKNTKAIENLTTDKIRINQTGLGNVSIRCAKEHSYVDGSDPQIEFFVLEEPITHKFYMSKDLKTKEYMFTFVGEAHKYSFGVLQNGDVIACLDADGIGTNTKDDANRQNPYVFLASENWEIQHEIDFGSSLKPCGWLENCGFKVLADGSAIFCEYTRLTTETANAWRLSGDPTNKNNWTVTQSFTITTTDNSDNFKHCHMVMQDFYTGICYLATGDSDKGAMLFASTNNGQSWTQLLSPDSSLHDHEEGFAGGSEKYCRMLSMTFTKDYIYWASDTAVDVSHYLFRAERDANGILDYSTVTDYVHIPKLNNAATYGTAYIPELNAILLLDRTDADELEMPVRMVTLSDGSLHTLGKLYSALGNTGANLGFRTRFSEWYPYNGLVRVGYDFRMLSHNNATNQNKGFGNEGHTSTGNGTLNINNLFLQIYKTGNDYGFHLGTYYT